MLNTEEFLYNIFGGNEFIHFNCIRYGGGPAIPKKGRYEEVVEQLEYWNKKDYEVYFVPNSGGSTNGEITSVNTLFIDLDIKKEVEKTGVDNSKEITLGMSSDELKSYKEMFYERLSKFVLQPSLIVDTGYGLHSYYLLEGGATIEQFNKAEKVLIEQLDADVEVKSPSNLMRVPNFYNCKNPDSKKYVEVLEDNSSKYRYNIEDVLSHFNVKEDYAELDSVKLGTIELDDSTKTKESCLDGSAKKEGCVPIININNNITAYYRDETFYFSTNIKLIKNKDTQSLQKIIQPKPITVNSYGEVYDYLKTQDLALLLGVENHRSRFNCIFHEDDNPSAGIFQNEKTGHYIMKCHSDNCGVSATIIRCIEHLLRCPRPEAINFLRSIYMIEFEETDWQREQKEILEHNKRYIMSNDFEIEHPELYKIIRSYVNELYILNDIAKDNVVTENFTDSNGTVLFFSSLKNIAKLCNYKYSNLQTLCDRISILCYFGLINKLCDKDIPEFLLRESERIRMNKGYNNRINYYSIPSYSSSVLEFSDKKVQDFKKNNLRIKGWGRDMLIRNEGESVADRVYPQDKGKPLNELNEEIKDYIENTMLSLIHQQGYTTKQQVLEDVKLYFRGQKDFKIKQFNRSLGQILKKNGLIEMYVNEKLKSELNIKQQGYPKIITCSTYSNKNENMS